jgi:hypothetical protein
MGTTAGLSVMTVFHYGNYYAQSAFFMQSRHNGAHCAPWSFHMPCWGSRTGTTNMEAYRLEAATVSHALKREFPQHESTLVARDAARVVC